MLNGESQGFKGGRKPREGDALFLFVSRCSPSAEGLTGNSAGSKEPRTPTSRTTAISSVPSKDSKDYQDHSATACVPRQYVASRCSDAVRSNSQGAAGAAPPTSKDYKAHQATRGPPPPTTGRKPTGTQDPPRGKMATPGAEAEPTGC